MQIIELIGNPGLENWKMTREIKLFCKMHIICYLMKF